MPGMSLERLHAPRDPVAKQQREAGVQRQQARAPGSMPSRFPAPTRAGARTAGNARSRGAATAKPRPLRQYVCVVAAHGGGRLALHPAADGNHIAADVCIGPELDIAEHRHDIAVDRTVDVGVAQDRDCATAQRPGDARIAEDRHHFASLAFAARGTQDRHHRIGTLPARQIRIAPDVDEILAVAVMPAIDLVAPLIETSRSLGSRASAGAVSTLLGASGAAPGAVDCARATPPTSGSSPAKSSSAKSSPVSSSQASRRDIEVFMVQIPLEVRSRDTACDRLRCRVQTTPRTARRSRRGRHRPR